MTTDDPEALFRQAMAHHQAGDLDQACALYRRLVERFPDHAKLLELFGTALLQLGRLEPGTEMARRALKIAPDNVALWLNCGHGLSALGRNKEALECYERAASRAPNDPNTHDNRGRALAALGRNTDAAEAFARAVALSPDDAGLVFNHGLMLFALDRFDAALAAFRRAAALRPDFAQARLCAADALVRLGRRDEALAAFADAIAKTPTADAFRRRGDFFRAMRRRDEALADYARAVAIRPDAETLCVRAELLLTLNRHAEALADLDRAIGMVAGFAPAHNVRGLVLTALEREVEALTCFDRAAALDPGHAEIYLNNRGNALAALNRFDEAQAAFEAAIAKTPDYAEAQANLGLIHLRRGEFAKGWPLYEWRWKVGNTQDAMRTFAAATVRLYRDTLWTGKQNIAGKCVLLHAEQGLGDIVQFARYVPMVTARGAKVIVETRKPILSLLSTLPCDLTLRVIGEHGAEPFDLHCPILSLPAVFATTLKTVPNTVPYLAADPAKREAWRAKLGEKTRARIGLVWSGDPSHEHDRQRSFPLRTLAPLLTLPCEFHSLQKVIRETDQEALAAFPQLALHGGDLHDFSDTAALIAEMDLTISVDTSVAHVAGALGVPVWILVQWSAEWRWMIERRDSPWYPTATLFRQHQAGDWAGVIADVVTEAKQRFGV